MSRPRCGDSGRPPHSQHPEAYLPHRHREFSFDRKQRRAAPCAAPDDGQAHGRGCQPLFSRQPGSFDFRAHAIEIFLSQEVTTSARRAGLTMAFPGRDSGARRRDCEDLRFCLRLCSNIAHFAHLHPRGAWAGLSTSKPARGGFHAWVVYQCEDGGWEVLGRLR